MLFRSSRIMKTILETKELCKYYQSHENVVKAVDHIDLQIQQGEFVTIIGKSGSGKSTLLHLLGGLDNPTSGEVWIDGKNIAGYTGEQLAALRRQKIGFIFQAFNLVPSLNVWENVVLPIGLDDRKVDEAFVEDILKTLGMEEKVRNLPNTLSGGQQQRTAIARAIAAKPSIILADEPTGNVAKVQHYPKEIPVMLLSLSTHISDITDRHSVRFSSRVSVS